jgi:hypothetical protein
MAKGGWLPRCCAMTAIALLVGGQMVGWFYGARKPIALGMTAIAILGSANKNTALMAALAASKLMRTEQRKSGLTVIEFFISTISLRMRDGR